MIIDHDLSALTIDSQAHVGDALKRISSNRLRFVLCVAQSGLLEGALTDGDFRRWVAREAKPDLTTPASAVCNRTPTTAMVSTPPDQIAAMLSESITFVPLLDNQGKLVAVARIGDASHLRVGPREIGPDRPAFVIAEIGINHNGSLDLAKQLVDAAVSAGADCAKFQMRQMSTLYRNAGDANDASEDLGAQYTLDVLARSSLSNEELFEVFDYCRESGIIPLCTPWDIESVAALYAYGVDGFKIASADLTNHDLLLAISATRKPIFLSTGMSTESEIVESTTLLKAQGANVALLHCNSAYPAPFKDVNLRYMDRLHEISGGPVGYSGHERGFAVAVAAVARGAAVIEKHITLDRGMLGNDHKVSLQPDEFAAMVRMIREVEQSIGERAPRQLTQGERMNREVLAKSLVASTPIAKGAVIDAGMLDVKSPGKGLQPNHKAQLVGRKATRDFAPGDFFFQSDLADLVARPRAYSFKRRWGIPVRYHDWRALSDGAELDFLEFHYSYKDLDANPADFFSEQLNVGLVVHSPDLFADDHIMNLAAEDDEYREVSIQHLQRLIDTARSLRAWFPAVEKIPIVASLGGFSREAPIPTSHRASMYERVAHSLSQLNVDGVEILPQTLPPFPWYLGGQLFCNLFVDPEDTAEFCRETKHRLCLDISHTKLATNQRKRPLADAVELLAPHAAHLHIVDAQGVDGEGLQIGEGEIDFADLAKRLDRLCPAASFIPEIWQGHKNGGEGFWIALERLEGLF